MGLPKAYDPNPLASHGEYQLMETLADVAGCGVSHLPALRTGLDQGLCPYEPVGDFEIDVVFCDIGRSLSLVPLKLHTLIVYTRARVSTKWWADLK